MASTAPVKELRSLADWRDELGLDRLRADLINGDLDAWWQRYETGEWHQIPRAHWRQERAVEVAVEEWGMGSGWAFGPFSSDLVRLWAARPLPSRVAEPASEPSSSEQRRTPPGWAQKPVIEKLRDKYPPDGMPPEGTTISDACRAIGEDPARKWKTVDRAVKRLKCPKR
jgi:hypothetical protein